ncbi:1,3-beta-glucanase [Methylorubrum rhodesianum]|uniref:1,3-beta-glucanase n=1 Tax=Methylorubrum rhodesianum TaxID=29427 RepID=UPI003D057D6E
MATIGTLRFGLVIVSLGLGGLPALAQTSAGNGLPFGPTSTVATVAAPTPAMAIANPGGLSFGGASGVSGLGTSRPGIATNAGGLRFGGGGGVAAASGSGGLTSGGSGLGRSPQRPLDDVTGSIGIGGGGAPSGAGISGSGFSRRPTDAYFDPLSGSGLR